MKKVPYKILVKLLFYSSDRIQKSTRISQRITSAYIYIVYRIYLIFISYLLNIYLSLKIEKISAWSSYIKNIIQDPHHVVMKIAQNTITFVNKEKQLYSVK